MKRFWICMVPRLGADGVRADIEDVDHAIILDGDSGNYYSYKDPLNGKRGDIPKSQVEYAIKIYGTKTSEEK